MNRKYRLGIFGLSISLLLGCGAKDSSPTGHLIDGQRPTTDQLKEQIRQQHKIHVYFTPDDGTPAGWMEISQAELLGTSDWNCQQPWAHSTVCTADIDTTRQQLCLYRDILDVMEVAAEPYEKHTLLTVQVPGKPLFEKEGKISIPRQSVATVAVLAEYLTESNLLDFVKAEYAACSNTPQAANCAATQDCPSQIEMLSSNVVQAMIDHVNRAYDLTEEMTNVAVKNILAAADGSRSSAPPGLGAEQKSWTQPILSRSAAARLLLGGSLESNGFVDGFCSGRALSAGERKAAELLRSSGVSIADLANTQLSTDSLLHDASTSTNSDPSKGSVAKRLSLVTGSAQLAAITNLPSHYGLTESDFSKARQYLVGETNAFARDTTLYYPVDIQSADGKTKFHRYAATSMPSSNTPDEYFATLVTAPAVSTSGNSPTIVDSPSLAGATYIGLTQLALINEFIGDHSTSYATTDLDALRELTSFAVLKMNSTQSSVLRTTTYDDAGQPKVSIFYGTADPNDTRKRSIVLGDAALRCAVYGNDGVEPCASDSLKDALMTLETTTSCGPPTNANCFIKNFDKLPSSWGTPNKPGIRAYVVHPKANYTTDIGGYEVEFGFVTKDGFSGYSGVPTIAAQAAQIVRPSESWCNMPRLSCSGASFDDRLPLEDELASDTDGVESSWKHYLNLAKDAATQADALGQSYVAASLQFDQKISDDERYAEQRRQQLNATIETLQDTCGTELDIDKVKTALFGNTGETCASDSDCTTGKCSNNTCHYTATPCSQTSDCGTNQSCVAGICMPDLGNLANDTAEPDVQRLAGCIGSKVIDFAALGDHPLCVVKDSSNTNNYCPSSVTKDGFSCPGLADSDGQGRYNCSRYIAKYGDANVVTVEGDNLLNLFTVSGNSGGSGPNGACVALKAARQGKKSVTSDDGKVTIYPLGFLAGSDWLLPTEITELAPRIGYEARFGSYGAVTLDDVPIFTTGALGSPATDWPCANASQTALLDETLLDTLVRCEATNPQDPAAVLQAAKDRGAINDRLMRAVIMLRYVAGIKPTQGLKLPILVPEVTPRPTVARTFNYQADGNGTGHQYDFITVFESRSGAQGSRSQVFFSDEAGRGYPATYTMWLPGTDLTQISLVVPDTNNNNYWLSIAELNTTIDASIAYIAHRHYCKWHYNYGFVPGRDCHDYDEPIPSVKRVSAAAWLRGLYRTAVPLAADDEGSDGTDWYYNALKNRRDGTPMKSLNGFVQFATNASFAFGDVEYSDLTLLDALELACNMKGKSVNNVAVDVSKMPTIASPADFPALQAYMEALAARIEDWAGTFVIAHVPADALDFRRETSKAGAFPKLGGSFATAVTTLRGDLVSLTDVAPLISEEIRRLGSDLSQASIAIARANNNQELDALQNQANTISQMTQCAVAVANTPSLDVVHAAGAALAAVAQCAGAVALTMIGDQELAIQNANIALDKQQAIVNLQQQISSHGESLQKYAKQISDAVESIDGQLAEIERQREKGRRAAAEALRQLSFENAASKTVSSDLASIRETAKTRYEYAFDVAKRTAFLARRAIEQRLGLNLDELADDMPLVEAPQRWAGTVCERSGIDWKAVQASDPNTPANFSDAFIGDYVSKLERVVESYRLDHSFHEGSDTSVVSLRDDVLNVRAPCDVPTDNLLFNTQDLSVTGSDGALAGVWRPYNCNTRQDSSGSIISQNCIVPVATGEQPYVNTNKDFGSAQGVQLVYGIDTGTKYGDCDASQCDYRADTGWAQRVNLGAGRYRLSWYSKVNDGAYTQDAGSFTGDPDVTVNMIAADGTSIPFVTNPPNTTVLVGEPTLVNGWFRSHGIFELTQATNVDIVFYRSSGAASQKLVRPSLAGPMLEDLTNESVSINPTASEPKPFTATTNIRTRRLPICQDTAGSEFRSKWVRKCVPLCPDGFAGTCNPATATTQCFWEVPFSISQQAIEAGKMFTQAGFAQGNFNYRISSIGVNVVGTGVKNCTNTLLPSTCYSSGNIAYTLDHVGPYTIRNYAGANYDAKLFTGHIEHARGLAAERYLSNPISSTDQGLMSDYMRLELQGRPLDGNFILKIWDDPNTAFDGVQDIQVILKYSYWTRFD